LQSGGLRSGPMGRTRSGGSRVTDQGTNVGWRIIKGGRSLGGPGVADQGTDQEWRIKGGEPLGGSGVAY